MKEEAEGQLSALLGARAPAAPAGPGPAPWDALARGAPAAPAPPLPASGLRRGVVSAHRFRSEAARPSDSIEEGGRALPLDALAPAPREGGPPSTRALSRPPSPVPVPRSPGRPAPPPLTESKVATASFQEWTGGAPVPPHGDLDASHHGCVRGRRASRLI